jgi:hypothetical protein
MEFLLTGMFGKDPEEVPEGSGAIQRPVAVFAGESEPLDQSINAMAPFFGVEGSGKLDGAERLLTVGEIGRFKKASPPCGGCESLPES